MAQASGERARNVACCRCLWPFGFHCTGMPIQAAADNLRRELARWGGRPPAGAADGDASVASPSAGGDPAVAAASEGGEGTAAAAAVVEKGGGATSGVGGAAGAAGAPAEAGGAAGGVAGAGELVGAGELAGPGNGQPAAREEAGDAVVAGCAGEATGSNKAGASYSSSKAKVQAKKGFARSQWDALEVRTASHSLAVTETQWGRERATVQAKQGERRLWSPNNSTSAHRLRVERMSN